MQRREDHDGDDHDDDDDDDNDDDDVGASGVTYGFRIADDDHTGGTQAVAGECRMARADGGGEEDVC